MQGQGVPAVSTTFSGSEEQDTLAGEPVMVSGQLRNIPGADALAGRLPVISITNNNNLTRGSEGSDGTGGAAAPTTSISVGTGGVATPTMSIGTGGVAIPTTSTTLQPTYYTSEPVEQRPSHEASGTAQMVAPSVVVYSTPRAEHVASVPVELLPSQGASGAAQMVLPSVVAT